MLLVISAYFEGFSVRLPDFFSLSLSPLHINAIALCVFHELNSGYKTLELFALHEMGTSPPRGVRPIHLGFVKSIFTQYIVWKFSREAPTNFPPPRSSSVQKMRRHTHAVHSLFPPFSSLSNRHNKNATDPDGIIRSVGRDHTGIS